MFVVETGEGRTPRPEEFSTRICYRLSRYLILAPVRPYRRGLPGSQPDSLWSRLSASRRPHLDLCRPSAPFEER